MSGSSILLDWVEARQARTHEWATKLAENGLAPLRIDKPLGEESGEDEWAQSDKAFKLFMPTDEYVKLVQRDTLFLFGRRGSGKTYVLNYMAEEVRSGNLSDYTHSYLVWGQELIPGLAMIARDAGAEDGREIELTQAMARLWRVILQASALASLCEDQEWPGVNEIVENFGANGISVESSKDFSRDLFGFLGRAVEQMPPARDLGLRLVSLAEHCQKSLLNVYWRQARERQVKAARFFMVLLDSSDAYAQRDTIHRSIVAGLIEALLGLYNEQSRERLVALAAFPAEVVSHITPLNWGKTVAKTVWLQWSHRELVCFAAMRLAAHLREANIKQYEKYENAIALFETVFPKDISTRAGHILRTTSYIIRHSQKTPRHVLQLLNAILTDGRGNKRDVKTISVEDIRAGVHTAQDALVREVFDVFGWIYGRDLRDSAKFALDGMPAYFPATDFDARLTTIGKELSRSAIDTQDVQRLVLAAGVVGIATGHSAFPRQPGKEITWLLEAQFEYETRHVLSAPRGTVLCVHPMFYNWLRTSLDTRVVVFPSYQDQEERAALAAATGIDLPHAPLV